MERRAWDTRRRRYLRSGEVATEWRRRRLSRRIDEFARVFVCSLAASVTVAAFVLVTLWAIGAI